ncbi:MAG: hypothetical protein ABSE56_10770 [Bryobacteraceae bacterium]|jgi:hypothetical protein
MSIVRPAPLLLFVAACAVAALQFSNGHFGPGFEPVAIARNLVEGHGYANPFTIYPTGPTAHTPPLFPVFLAVLLRIFGYSANFALAACISCALVYALGVALLPALAELFFGDRWPGIWAAALMIVLPVFEFMPQYETAYAATACMLFYLAADRLARGGGATRGLAMGVFAGLIALLHTASTFILAPWVVWLMWRYRPARRPAFGLAMVLGVLLTLAPWTCRNYREFHALFFVRDNLGTEMYVSNNGLVGPSVKTGNPYHPSVNLAEAVAMKQASEFQYNRQRMALAINWIRQHRGQFLALTAGRAWIFWFTASQTAPARAWSVAFVTVAGMLGFAVMAVRREAVVAPILAVLVLYPLVFYIVQQDHRFREPLLWFSLLGVGYLLCALAAGKSRTA